MQATRQEWILLSRLLPQPSRAGRPCKLDLRTIMDAIRYILAIGCRWRALPKDFPPFTTVQHYFYDRRNRKGWQRINRTLVERARLAAGRKPCSPAFACFRGASQGLEKRAVTMSLPLRSAPSARLE
jgi:putative transposase